MRATDTFRSGRLRPATVLSAIASLALLAAACSPAQPNEDEETAAPDDGGSGEIEQVELDDSFADVLSEVEGLEGEEREAKLIELANQEESINIYTSNTEMQEQADEFEEYYEGRLEIRPSIYRAPSDTMLARILEEVDAGFQGADLTEVHSPELQALHESGVLREYTSPYLEARDQTLNFDDWFVVRMNVMAVEWNTERVSPDQVPTSLEELTDERWRDQVLVEPRAYDWFLTLWGYFSEELGWSDEQIEEYFRTLVDIGVIQEGYPEQTELLTTGEASLLSGSYIHLADSQRQAGAPVEFEPLIEPLVIDATGVGLIKNASNPAGALLFADYLLDQGRDLYRAQHRMPPDELEPGGLLDGVEYLITDPSKLVGDEGQMWRDRWDRILQDQPLED